MENEIDVTVYGYGWAKFECSNKEHLIVHNLVSFPVSLEVIADSKIVLNIMPWFKNGIHDRVLSAMANKADMNRIGDKYSYLSFYAYNNRTRRNTWEF